jgi:hypothetical protein
VGTGALGRQRLGTGALVMSDNVQGMTGSEVMRISRRMTGRQRSVKLGYPRFKSHYKLLCKTGAAAMLIAGTVLALGVGGRMAHVETSATHRPTGSARQCVKEYGELFDLAHLARRDGKSSDVMASELTVMSGRLSKCQLPAYRKNLAFYVDHTT